MKKDINFLESKKLVSGKKSTNTTVILVVVLLIVVCIVAAIFAQTKIKTEDLQDQITQLEQEKKNPKYNERTKQYAEVKDKLENYLIETLSKDVVENKITNVESLGVELFNAIYDAAGKDVIISSFTFEENKGHTIVLSCATLGNELYDIPVAHKKMVDFINELRYLKINDEIVVKTVKEYNVESNNDIGMDEQGNPVCQIKFDVSVELVGADSEVEE